MIQIIAGEKGKGKTKILIDNVNKAIKEAKGSIVYIDKSNKHMYELSNKIRLINCKDYLVSNSSEFIGFICGIVSQDHDLEEIYLDSFLKIACVEKEDVEQVFNRLNSISEAFHITIVISVSLDKHDLPESCYDKILVAL